MGYNFAPVVFVMLCIPCARSELFTALSDMELLLDTHKGVIDRLENYIEREERRLQILKRYLNLYVREHDEAMTDVSNYLGNPINAFTLIKRLSTGLTDVEYYVKLGEENINEATIKHEDVNFPTSEDLNGAVQALMRLKETYLLTIEDLAEGKLNGVSYSAPMSASDCYELGCSLYNENNYVNAIAWLKEALRKYYEENVEYPFTDVHIMWYINYAYYSMNDFRNSLYWSQKMLDADQNDTTTQEHILLLQNKIAEEDEAVQTQEEKTTEDNKPDEWSYEMERKTYEALCRGDFDVSPRVKKNLKCRYMSERHPFLKLAPIKMEQMYKDPDVILFHQVISDDEIEVIKELAKPRFQRATVNNPETGEREPANYRISKSAWLGDFESPVVARISQRIADMTGLSMTSAENLQVANYGIGGHYEPHFDFSLEGEWAYGEYDGNRIATVLFYMSEVAQGGATVFTKFGLSVFPVKYAAVFWMNLHPSGAGDFATKHAACPVLRGSKWVSNKWLHQRGQELIKPCNLEYQEQGILRKLPKAVFRSVLTS